MKFRIEIIGGDREEETVAYVRAPGGFTEKLEKFLSENEKDSGFTVYSEERDMFFTLPAEVIESISVIGTKTVVVDKDGREYTSKLRLYEAESRLPGTFFRINRSALINREYTERFEASFGGGMRAVMKSGHSDIISRRCLAAIRRRFAGKK